MNGALKSAPLLVLLALAGGCQTAQKIRDPEFARVQAAVHHSHAAPSAESDAVTSVAPPLTGTHPVETYVELALRQNPEVHAARKRVEALAYQVPVESSLQDPMLNVTALPSPVQTAAGEQQLIVAANQKVPWFGKLQTRADMAESRTDEARAELAAVELDVISRVREVYYQLYFIQQSIRITRADRQLLSELRQVAVTRYQTGQTSQQDVLRADLEIANVDNELIRLQQQLESAQARLARLLHMGPGTSFLATDELPPANIPPDLGYLQRQAVALRPELHARLAALRRDRQAIELTRLDYRPDVTWGVSWMSISSNGLSPVANGEDAVLLTAGMNLPVYRRRLDASIRSAEAAAVTTARQYDALRDATLEQVTDLFAQIQSQQDLLQLYQAEILAKAQQTLEVSLRGYHVGEIDFLQLVDNWRQLLRYQIGYERLQASLRQTLAELDRVMGGSLSESTATAMSKPAEEEVPLLSPEELENSLRESP